MKKVTVTIMTLLFVAAIATTVLAFGPGRGPGYGPCARGDFGGFAGLNLTADQQAKIKEMREARFKEIAPLRDQMFAKRDELRKLWLEPNPDQGKIAATQKEMRSVRDQMQDNTTAYRLDALKVLTPEQQEKLRSFATGRSFGPRMGFGPGRGGRGGAGCFGAVLAPGETGKP
jgi:Spy/CpxP family protein refolding chaperone